MRSIIGDQYALFFLTLWILWTCFLIFNFVYFFKFRNSIYIRNRDPMLIFCSALGQYAMMTSLTWKIVLLPQNFPNMVDLWFLWLFIPLHFMPYPVRSLRFIIQCAYKKYQFKKISNKLEKKNAFFEFLQDHPFLRQSNAYFILNWILMVIAIIIGVYRNVKYPINHPGQYGGENTRTYYISCIVLLVLASFFLWIAVHFQRQTGEELYVTAELITIGILWLIFISLYIIFAWMKIGSFRIAPIFLIILCISSFLMSFGMPVQLAVVLTSFFDPEERKKRELLYQESLKQNKNDSILDIKEEEEEEEEIQEKSDKAQSQEKENEKDENEKDEGENVSKYNTVEGVLEDNDTYDLILAYSQKRMCEETILFYRDVNIFKNCGDDELEDQFKKMVENYIKAGSAFQLNVLGAKLKEIENQTEPNREIFEPIMDDVMKLIKTEIFPNFKRSNEMAKFINEKMKKLKPKNN